MSAPRSELLEEATDLKEIILSDGGAEFVWCAVIRQFSFPNNQVRRDKFHTKLPDPYILQLFWEETAFLSLSYVFIFFVQWESYEYETRY